MYKKKRFCDNSPTIILHRNYEMIKQKKMKEPLVEFYDVSSQYLYLLCTHIQFHIQYEFICRG